MRIAPVVRSLAALAVVTLVKLGTVPDAWATDISQSYSFGPGTGTHTTNATFRTFAIPCGTPGTIGVAISLRHFGPSTANFTVDVEIHEPVRSGETEGRIADQGQFNTGVTSTERTVTVSVRPTAGGCGKPWLVRIKGKDGAPPPYSVAGTMKLTYSGETRNLAVATMSNQYLKKGESKTLLVESSAGCGQGRIVITGTWNHTIGIVPGPLPIELKFELINDAYAGSTNVIASAVGYSNNEARSELTKLRLVHQVPDCRVGQWKLRITNISNDDAFLNAPSAKMTPTCP